MRAGRDPKNKVKKVDKLRVRRDHPRCRSATWICMCGHTRNTVYILQSQARGSTFGHSHWILAFTTACTSVQAVIILW